MKCVYRMRPYELEKGIVNRKYKIWEQRCIAFITGSSISHSQFKKMCREMVHDFDTIPISDEKKPRVGIVGEIDVYKRQIMTDRLGRLHFPLGRSISSLL